MSVVIPVFNRREQVGRAIESVLAQTRPPEEVIIVDDASGDGTPEAVRRRFPDVVLLENDRNRGVSHSRNRGVARARGDWVAFLDSDDEWLPAKLARQCEALACTDAPPLCHTDEIWIRRGVRVNPRRRHEKRGGDIFEHCLPLCVISPSSALLSRDLLDELGGFDETLPACEDYDLWLRICVAHPVCFVPEKLLVKYGGHADQLSRRYWGMDRFRVAALGKLLAAGDLDPRRRRAVLAILIEKLEILHKGAVKRNRMTQALAWRAQLDEARRLERAVAA
ncbi:MAG: glycosyltransferase [Proteobacteria bacterium]|nr:MAG: glycosyltransferase [Pseudomonadota bacterium]